MTPRVVQRFRRLDRELVRRQRHVVRRFRSPVRHDDAVLRAVVSVTGFSLGELAGRGRYRTLTYARHLAMFALRSHARLGPADIGRLLDRDHSTVLEGARRIELELTWREETRADAAAIVGQLLEASA